MYEVNRSLALIKPKAPFLAWLQGLPGSHVASLPLAELQKGCNGLLVPPADDADEARAFVVEQYASLFAAELADWCEDEALWPTPLTPALFAEWFDIEIHPVLTDLVDEALEREAFVPFDLPDA